MIRLRRGPDHLGTLSIGDLPLELHGTDPFLIETIERRYGPFLTDDLGDVRIAIGLLDETRKGGGRDGAPAYAPTTEYRDRRLTMRSEVLEATVDFATGEGSIEVIRCASASEYYLENALRQIVQILAIERDAVLLHSAAVAPPEGDRVFLFAGRSGAGKSTISEILRDAGGQVLSDDLVLLETRAASPQIVSTPFYGTLPPRNPKPVAIPLTTAFLLEQASEASASDPLALPAAVAALLTNVPFTGPLDAETHCKMMDVISRATRVVPVRTLRFRRDRSMLPLLGWQDARKEVVR